jgi:hypothetical protein
MANNGSDGWNKQYQLAKQIETETGLPAGSIKTEAGGFYALTLLHLTEEQIRQMAHLWYVLSHTAVQSAHPVAGAHRPVDKTAI